MASAASPPVLTRLGEGRFGVRGPIACPHCGGDRFEERRGVLDTRTAAFFDMTWANRGSTELICFGCGFVITFANPR